MNIYLIPFQKGFTLIELLVAVIIIAILAAIAFPQYEKAVEKSRAHTNIALIKSLADASQRYRLTNGSYPDRFSVLDIGLPEYQTVSSNDCSLAVSTGAGYSITSTDSDRIVKIGDYQVVMNTTTPGQTLSVSSARKTPRYGCYAFFFNAQTGQLRCGVHITINGPKNFCRDVMGLTNTQAGNGWTHYIM